MTEIGSASLAVIPTFDKFGPALDKGTSKAMLASGQASGTKFGDAAGRSAGSRFGSVFKTVAKASLIGLAGLGAVAFKVGKDSVAAASDLGETVSKTGQIFGKKALPELERFADGAAKSMGQSKQSALDAVSTFGIMGKVAGLQGPKLGKFSTKLATLSSDMASFSNTTPQEAIDALGSALRGEAEPIRKYGVLLDEASLKAEAMRIGILKPVKDAAKIKTYQARILEGQRNYNEAIAEFGPKSIEAIKAQAALGTAQAGLQKATDGTIPPLTQQQKVLAAQSAIFRQTSDQQGDFQRTSGGLANQQRILAAEFDNVKTKLGVGLLPIVTDFTSFLNTKGVPVLEDFSDWFTRKGVPAISNFADFVKDDVSPALSDLVDFARPLGKSILPEIGDAAGTVKDAFKEMAPFVGDVFDAFNKLPDGVKKGLLIGGGALMLKKLLGGKGADKAATDGLISRVADAVKTKSAGLIADKLLARFSKPLPVIVMNPGVAGIGGAAGGTAAGAATGKVATILSKGVLPVAIVAASAKGLKEFFDWNHKDDKSVVEHAITGGNMGDKSRQFWAWVLGDSKEYDKSLGVVNNSWTKVRTQIDGAREDTVLYDGTIRKVPTLWTTTFGTPGLVRDMALVKQYGSMLDGLDGRVVTTFLTSINNNNDTGEGGGGTVPGRSPSGSGGVSVHVDKVVAQDYNDFMYQVQNRARRNSLDGRRTP